LSVTLGDFTATEHDAVLVGDSPHAAVGIVIDNSGSMGGAEIAEAKSAAISFVQGMDLGDEVAVVTFNSAAAAPQPLIELANETVRDQVISEIQDIVAGGGTNIGSGINMGNTQLNAATVGFARAQVLMSDGFDGSPAITESAIQNTPVDVDIHTIALTTASDQELLADIAERTGGTFHFAPSPTDLTDLYRLIRAAIGSDETSASGSFGVLGQGDSQEAEFTVSSAVGTLSAQLDWLGSDFDLALTAPSGRVITEASSDPDVNVVAGATHVAIEITSPEVGQWSLEATGVDVQTAQEVTYRVEESGSTIRSRLYLSGAEQAGEPMQIHLALTEASSGVVGATVMAHVTDPVGETRVFRMSDDGAQADGRADDGVYGASVLGTNTAGSYTVRVIASGSDGNDAPFSRIESGSLFAAAMVDGDADGIANNTESAIGLDPLDPADGSEDHDTDGLNTSAEIEMGSDPTASDSDDGGESDGSEAAGGRDVLNPSDDLDIASAFLDPRPVDGRTVQVAVASDDGTGTVELTRVAQGVRTALGIHPGSGSIVTDGPLAAGTYQYEAVVVSAGGTRSAPTRSGPVIVGDDVTRPAARLFLNGGTSTTSNSVVSAEFRDESEELVEMRLALSEDGLASAAWQTYADPTSITVGPNPGTYTVYAQVRDAAGLASEITSATVVFTAQPPLVTERVSESSQHGQGNGLSHEAYISADGRYVTFESEASDLVSGDTNGAADVFVRDRVTDTTTRVSIASSGTQGNGSSEDPTISPDGRYVAFRSNASNLASGDTNNKYDIFLHDRQTGTTTRVSVTSTGAQATGASDSSVVAADGAAVVFRSFASNLVGGDTNGETDIFVRDLVAGTTTRVSVSSAGAQANAGTDGPTISDDGRFVAFDSTASTLVANDTNAASDVFLHDRTTGATTRVSVAAGGTQATGASWEATLDADGSMLAFQSSASNLVSADTNAKDDAFVVTVATGAIVRASAAGDGSQGNNHAGEVSLSADGTLLAFFSSADNLVAGDTNGKGDVFVRDLVAGTTTRWSVATNGSEGDGRSTNPTIAGAGHTVAFHSFATDLVANDTNGVADVFVRGPDQ
jgi:Tol biopolymer transport system component